MIERINGIDLHYEIEGTGEPLLLLHGFTGCGANWKLVFSAPPAGFQVIRPDLRGHGGSTGYDVNFTNASLGTITARTLIVHGDGDPLYPVAIATAISASRLWLVPGGGHGPIFGNDSGMFVETAMGFLRGEPR